MITATFSNGYTDTYKGSRDVKAAWMVTEKATGKVIASGHSLNKEVAEKTAKSSTVLHTLPAGWRKWRKDVRAEGYAKLHGYKSVVDMEASMAKANAEFASSVKIEVIAL